MTNATLIAVTLVDCSSMTITGTTASAAISTGISNRRFIRLA